MACNMSTNWPSQYSTVINAVIPANICNLFKLQPICRMWEGSSCVGDMSNGYTLLTEQITKIISVA